MARGDGNEGATAVSHYRKWGVGKGDTSLRPLRTLDPSKTSLEVKAREVVRVARSALFLVQVVGVSAKLSEQLHQHWQWIKP